MTGDRTGHPRRRFLMGAAGLAATPLIAGVAGCATDAPKQDSDGNASGMPTNPLAAATTVTVMAQHPWVVPIPSATRTAHLAENLGAEDVVFSGDELQELNQALSTITIHGERLQPAVLAQTGVEARPV